MSLDNLHNPFPDAGAFSVQIARRLQKLYPVEFSEGLVNRIMALVNRQMPAHAPWDENDIILITYGNTLVSDVEKPLDTLYRFLRENLSDIVNGIHILPFFPSTSDDGFAVSDFMVVDPALGNWDSIKKFAGSFSLMADLVINHVSSQHPWFKYFLYNRIPYQEYFIEASSDADYSKVVRPRSTPLFTSFSTPAGLKKVWTTFSEDQIDLNFANPEVLLEMIRIMVLYINQGVRIIRLDAIAFLWKRSGTTCLHLPETHEIVKLLRDIASILCPGTIILTETNVPNKQNWSYFGNGDEAHMVYQFSLPPLLLHALFSGNSQFLSAWAAEIPTPSTDQTFLNYTASHDGIGVRPLEGILPEEEIALLIEGMIGFGGLISKRANSDGTQSPYEINITYFDAMKGTRFGTDQLQEARFICSQMIMMTLPGIPALYIHSLLATSNDYQGVELTGIARRINRQQLQMNALNQNLAGNTVSGRTLRELSRVIRIRKQCTAFHPGSSMEVLNLGDKLFAFRRCSVITGERISCISNLGSGVVEIRSVLSKNRKGYDLLSGDVFTAADPILFKACQTRWIAEQESKPQY